MQAIINSGKYKITEVLKSHFGYEAMLCSDVTVNSNGLYIVNRYSEQAYIRELLILFYDMEKKRVASFCGLASASGSFDVIFKYHKGVPFDEYYSECSKDYEKTIKYADSLLRCALEFDLTDDRIAACGLTTENVVIDTIDERVYFNMMLDPDVSGSGNFRTERLGEMLNRMFERNRYLPDVISDFIDKLSDGEFKSCSAAYAEWRSIQSAAEKMHKEYLKESILKYLGRRAKKKIKKQRKRKRA